MNIEEQNKELRRLRLYILQINRCNMSKRPSIISAWALDKDFSQYVNTVTAIIKKYKYSVDRIRGCTKDDYSLLSEIDRLRLISMAREIREVDEITEQDLFIKPYCDKEELNKLRKSCRTGKPEGNLLKKYQTLFALLPSQKASIMTDNYIRGIAMKDIAKEYKVSISRIGKIVKQAIKEIATSNRKGWYEQSEEA